jgi:hypothetical protein
MDAAGAPCELGHFVGRNRERAAPTVARRRADGAAAASGRRSRLPRAASAKGGDGSPAVQQFQCLPTMQTSVARAAFVRVRTLAPARSADADARPKLHDDSCKNPARAKINIVCVLCVNDGETKRCRHLGGANQRAPATSQRT